jgi:hypothetical protein
VRLFLALTVSLSFLAGQACSGGIGMFLPIAYAESEEILMSKMVVRCLMDGGEVVTVPEADCGPGKCIENVKDDPDEASASVVQPKEVCPPTPQNIADIHESLIAYHEPLLIAPDGGRPPTVVRME